MKAEFFRPEKPDEVLAVAVWDGRAASIEAADDSVREPLQRIFRPTPVGLAPQSDGPGGGTAGAVVEPGDLEWFLTAAMIRGEREGLGVRFVSESPGGWDPAGTYRSMGAWVAEREATRPSG
jgi:hypothetical protein